MECKKYIGITLTWDCTRKHVTLSILNYVTTALHKFQNGILSAPKNSLHIHVKPSYGANIQYTNDPDSSPR